MNPSLDAGQLCEFAAVREILADMEKRFSREEMSRFLIGWKIDVDSGNSMNPTHGESETTITVEVVDCTYDHFDFYIIAKSVGYKFPDQDTYESVLQEMQRAEGRHSNNGMTKIPVRLIQNNPEFRRRYGGTWMAPHPMLVPLTKMVLSEVKPRSVANQDAASQARHASESVKEREVACLARLRATRERWASAPGHSLDAAPWVWARVIRDVYGMRASGILTEWEVRFAGSLVRSSYEPDLRLSPRQQKVLREIGQKLITNSALP